MVRRVGRRTDCGEAGGSRSSIACRHEFRSWRWMQNHQFLNHRAVARMADSSRSERNPMFEPSPIVVDLQRRLEDFMAEHIYPNERRFYRESEIAGPWGIQPVVEELKPIARKAGLWNLFFTHDSGLNNLDYATLCEITGRSLMAPEVFNCSAPDVGNMEVLAKYGTPAQQERWLKPLLDGEIRSSFAMTEPEVASSDATNIGSIVRTANGLEGRLTGGPPRRAWWLATPLPSRPATPHPRAGPPARAASRPDRTAG